MLKRISCDQFLENGVKRPPFEFKDGLNTILGNGQNSNSVGKSTLLMIIDFCFGGNDYVDKEKDTLENIGDHKINFEFVFNGVIFSVEFEVLFFVFVFFVLILFVFFVFVFDILFLFNCSIIFLSIISFISISFSIPCFLLAISSATILTLLKFIDNSE